MRVIDVMSPGLIGVPETASLEEALQVMVSRNVSSLLAFDAIGAVVGILSEGDLMRRAELGAEKKRPRWVDFLLAGRAARDYARSHGRRVEEIMTRGVLTVEANAEVGEAVDLMLSARVRRLLVMRGAEPVGVISRSDLVRALIRAMPASEGARDDAAIQADIEAEIARQPWAPAGAVRVGVLNGVATFEGAITDDKLREGLKALAETVPGVKAVHDRLAWIEPNSGFCIEAPNEV
ncbi:MAG: CBS domain-containing protein [Pseudomonadota bacterium]|nr:CBS domain-containing protein [Pseudomonadota bacterium]